MKTTTTTTATEKKNSRKNQNAGTVKNNSKKAAKTTTAAADPEEEKKNRRAAAAKKAAETRRQRREEEARQMEEERRRIEAEAAARRKAENKNTRAADREELKNHRANYSRAKKELKTQSPLYYMHNLNKIAQGKAENTTAESTQALQWCYNDINELTQTADNYEGFSYNCVRVDSRGRICKMVKASDDVEIIYYSYGVIRVYCRQGADLDMITTYAGNYVLIPVNVNEDGILTAAQTVTALYKEIFQDCRNIYREKTTRQAMRERQQKRRAAAMKAAAEKAEREQMKTAARTAREAAEAAPAVEPAEAAPAVELQPARRSWWKNLAASLF